MATALDTATKNAMVDAVYSVWGPNLVMKVFTGNEPTTTSDANAGTILGTINLPGDWMAPVSGGAAGLTTQYNFTAVDTGTAGHLRIYSSDGTTCRYQGRVGINFTVNPSVITNGQNVILTAMVLIGVTS